VRYVEVLDNLNFTNGTGWDTHNDGQEKQHLLIQSLDQALSTLMDDLEAHDLLDKTLIIVAGEFGRPSSFDSGGGRGHQGSVFSVLMAGGGLRHKGAIGVTDPESKHPIERPITVPDWHATIYHALGIDYTKDLFDGDRPVPLVDRGNAIRELFV
jgi:arylsulfatase A-like enzyme